MDLKFICDGRFITEGVTLSQVSDNKSQEMRWLLGHGFDNDGTICSTFFGEFLTCLAKKIVGLLTQEHKKFEMKNGGLGDSGCIIEFAQENQQRPSFIFSIGPINDPKKNWAEEKLHWLKSSGRPYTYPMGLHELLGVIDGATIEKDPKKKSMGYVAGIRKKHANDLTDAEAVLLKECNVVPYYGAFYCGVNIIAKTVDNSPPEDVFNGKVYIAVSGAKQEDNLKIAMKILKLMAEELKTGQISKFVQRVDITFPKDDVLDGTFLGEKQELFTI